MPSFDLSSTTPEAMESEKNKKQKETKWGEKRFSLFRTRSCAHSTSPATVPFSFSQARFFPPAPAPAEEESKAPAS